MKRLNLSKELFFGSVLIGVLSIGLVSCGGGGGGGVSTSQPSTTQPSTTQPSTIQPGSSTSQPSSSSTLQPSTTQPSIPHLNFSFTSYIYQGKDNFNEPIMTVYIDGQPVQLVVDTGASGLVVNQSAVNIPSSDYTSYSFYGQYGDGAYVSGTIASATVCLNPSVTYTCVVMPVGVNISGDAFSNTSWAQGDIGLDSSFNSQDYSKSSGSTFIGYSYPTYLAQEYGVSSYTISFYPLSNTFYANVSSTTPIGKIVFSTSAPSNYLSYTYTYAIGLPSATAVFPSYTSSVTSYTQPVVFDTGSTFNALSTTVFQTEIPNFSSSDENQNTCLFGSGVLNGGFNIAYVLPYSSNTAYNYATNYYSTTFITEPPNGFCSSGIQFNVMIDNTWDAGPYSIDSVEIFGLPEMLRHTFVWVLNNQGFVQGISIDPQ